MTDTTQKPALGWIEAVQYQLERGYLERLGDHDQREALTWEAPQATNPKYDWAFVELHNIPLASEAQAAYSLNTVLSALHSLPTLRQSYRLVFRLLGDNGRYSLSMGLAHRPGQDEGSDLALASEQVAAVLRSHLPGLRTVALNTEHTAQTFRQLVELDYASAITGRPTVVAEGGAQHSLDRFAAQLRDGRFCLLVLADPLTSSRFDDERRRLAALVRCLRPTAQGLKGAVQERLKDVTQRLPLHRQAPSEPDGMLEQLLEATRRMTGLLSEPQEEGDADELARLVEQLHASSARLQRARGAGLWEVGVYLLSDSAATNSLGSSLLGSLASGEGSHADPVRVHDFSAYRRPQLPRACVQLLQFPCLQASSFGLTRPHPLGPGSTRLTTVLSSDELSRWMALPGRDLPGVSAAPRPPVFATNFGGPPEGSRALMLGQLTDSGEALNQSLVVPLDVLTRHLFITGLTGSGKSVTSRHLLGQLTRAGVGVLVIEPAKTEYLEWGVRLRQAGKAVRLFCPGMQHFGGVELDRLQLNPFEVPDGYPVLSHLDRLKATLNAAFPMQEVLPILLESALVEAYTERRFLESGDKPDDVPDLNLLLNTVRRLLSSNQSYSEDVRRNLLAALENRIKSLQLGFKGDLFNVERSTPLRELFDGITVVNLSMLSDDADKSLVMGLLVGLLYEYRTVQKPHPHLKHLAMIEEAHRILRGHPGGIENAKTFAAEAFADLLAEVRAYGQGIAIVDQVPAKLIPDALKNTNLKLVHRLQARDDQQALASAMGLTDEQMGAIPRLGPGQAIVQVGNRAALIQIPFTEEPK